MQINFTDICAVDSGRATHTHIMVHFNGTQFDNGTYSGGYVSHVGQLFFDQSLISAVSKVSPYSTNTQSVTLNSADSILSEETGNGHDPFVEYSLLSTSDDVSEGIFAWISFGIDLTQQESVTGASTLTSSGGVANANSGMGGGGGNGGSGGSGPGSNVTSGGGNSGRPSGAGSMPPNGTGDPESADGNGTLTTSNGTAVGGGGSSTSNTVSSSTLVAGASGSGVVSAGLLFVLAAFGFL